MKQQQQARTQAIRNNRRQQLDNRFANPKQVALLFAPNMQQLDLELQSLVPQFNPALINAGNYR